MQQPASLAARDLFVKVKAAIAGDPALTAAFDRVRLNAKKFRKPGVYDITSKCNLWCEGCYYFAGDNHAMRDEEDTSRWEKLFSSERERGVKFAYIGGAEPALHPKRIALAAENIPYGTMATNGTLKIDPEVQYRIVISVWGNEAYTTRSRGGSTFRKALRNFCGDKRAMFAYTINGQNIHQIREVAHIMDCEGVQLTFNMYSPTTSYLEKIKREEKNDDTFFRISSKSNNLCFSDADLKTCREVIDGLISEFPHTIVYPSAFNHEVTEPGPLYELDPLDGIATNCAGRHNGTHFTYLSNLQKSAAKCCMPNMDCENCRAVTSYLPSRLMPRPSDVLSQATVRNWLEICLYWSWFYLRDEYTPLSVSRELLTPV